MISGSRLGLIDLGTNTLRLVIGEKDAEGNPRFIFQEVIATRLGENLSATGEISPAAIQRTLEGIKKLRASAAAHGVTRLEAYATAWARAASNTDDMLTRLAEINLPVWILTEQEEAGMALEAVRLMPHFREKKDLWAIDIGGGSTEIIHVTNGKIHSMKSFPIGAVNVTESADIPDPAPRGSEARNLLCSLGTPPEVSPTLQGGAGDTSGSVPWPVAALGGTAAALSALKIKMTPDNPEFFNTAQGMILETKWINEMLAKLGNLSLEERKALPGMEQDRADILIGGTAILSEFLKTIHADQLTVCLYSFIHGLLILAQS